MTNGLGACGTTVILRCQNRMRQSQTAVSRCPNDVIVVSNGVPTVLLPFRVFVFRSADCISGARKFSYLVDGYVRTA